MGNNSLDAAGLLEACRDWFRRYIVLNEPQSNVLAVWVLHTWAIDAAETTAYLHITAAERACGKSRLLEALESIVRQPAGCDGVTAAALLRFIDKEHPTLLLDEVDTLLGGNKDTAEAVRGILNSGFRRGRVFRKCNVKTHAIEEFKPFCPKAFAGIGRIPGTVSSRSIVIEMVRKKPEERVESMHFREIEEAKKPLLAALASWSKSGIVGKLKRARPSFPDEFEDRQKDISEPLLAIADAAGGEWPQTIRQSLLALFRSEAAEDASLGVTLLRDIRMVFEGQTGKNADRVPSASLAAALVALEDSPWAEWRSDKGFIASTLARLLKPYRVHPKTVRFESGLQKGYAEVVHRCLD